MSRSNKAQPELVGSFRKELESLAGMYRTSGNGPHDADPFFMDPETRTRWKRSKYAALLLDTL